MLLFIFKCILICSLTGSFLIALMALARPLTERFFSSSWHYIVGLCIMLIMIFPIRITMPEKALDKGLTSVIGEEATAENEYFNNKTFYSVNAETENNISFSYQSLLTYFSYAWAITAAALLLRKKVGYTVFFRKMLRMTEDVTDSVPFKFEGFCIRKGKCVSSPMVTGVISPVLFLPDIPLSEEEMYVIISHERVHLRRRDIIAKKFITFVKCIHFFNPLVYVMANRIDLDCEISCDLAATKTMNGEEKKHYMLTILNLIAYGKAESPAFTVGILSGRETLKRRFFKIKNREKISKKTKFISAFIALTLILSCVLVSGVFAAELKKPETSIENLSAIFTRTEKSEAVTDKATDDISSAAASETAAVTTQAIGEPTDTQVPVATASQGDEHHNSSHPKEHGESDCALTYPCDEKAISSHFGDRGHHNGVDFIVQKGSDVYACADGEVISAGYDGNEGNSIRVKLSDGTVLVFSHLASICADVGDHVCKGQVIAKSGNSGASTGPHLHLSVIKNGKYVDPEQYLG